MTEAGTLEFRLLGPLEARLDDRPLPLGGVRQRALLALLLLRANEVVSRDRLIDELWRDHAPESAANALAALVARLRRVLPADVLVTRSGGYEARIEPDALDLLRFERLAEQGSRALAAGDAAAAAEQLHAALSLWRGPPLADFTYAPFAESTIGRLEELRLAAIENRIDADLALGRHGDLAGELQSLVLEHPLRERLRGQLMLALYRSGRQAEALEVYRDGRATLLDELGIDPSPALQELEQAILRQDPSVRAAAPAPGVESPPATTTPCTRSTARCARSRSSSPTSWAQSRSPSGSPPTRSCARRRVRDADEPCRRGVRRHRAGVRGRRDLRLLRRAGGARERPGARRARGAPHSRARRRLRTRRGGRVGGHRLRRQGQHQHRPSSGRHGRRRQLARRSPSATSTDVASRLRAAAEPGTILVGETTARRLAHRFAFEPLGEIEVRGREAPVAVSRLLAPSQSRADVGRHGERRQGARDHGAARRRRRRRLGPGQDRRRLRCRRDRQDAARRRASVTRRGAGDVAGGPLPLLRRPRPLALRRDPPRLARGGGRRAGDRDQDEGQGTTGSAARRAPRRGARAARSPARPPRRARDRGRGDRRDPRRIPALAGGARRGAARRRRARRRPVGGRADARARRGRHGADRPRRLWRSS